jgi:hypothetical protein
MSALTNRIPPDALVRMPIGEIAALPAEELARLQQEPTRRCARRRPPAPGSMARSPSSTPTALRPPAGMPANTSARHVSSTAT